METEDQSPAYVSVADFYAGKSVFITGVTGFVGKVFLEKLLYSCKDIDKVFVLIRDKKGLNAKQRVGEFIEKPLFKRLKEERPDDFKKVIPIAGDLNHLDLGISTEDVEILLQKVSVVFHVAATIKFNEELKDAVNTNVRGTKYVLHLCQRMKNIKAFVHVSTAYCNTDKQILEEKVYPPPADLGEVYKFLESNHDRTQVKELLKGLPNTYTFAKALAETYVAENHGNIPTVIIRPAIVSASLREPIAGWVDNWSSATGILAAVMKGATRVILADGENTLDLVPVDYVANLTIVAAARCSSADKIAVYNCCTSSCNPISIRNLFKYLKRAAVKNGFDDSQMSLTFTNKKWTLSTLTFLLQTTPAYFADLYLRATGQQPKYMQIQSRVIAGRDILEFFTSNSWEMKADRTRALHATLSPKDQHQFPCDPSNINWSEYITVYIEGINRFLLTKRF
ncbi:hypothetical protein PYW07_002034 [Mythimna separata]|uniref:Fatty acyl-CoA reductase n=1 Tax=Mythimna separata TaxID=271217 RepID=A0AAD7YNE3_MYTSE|nr:hypothetical protein PYW07_002034 [Mythimna separata]